jgi:hypothetical protein
MKTYVGEEVQLELSLPRLYMVVSGKLLYSAALPQGRVHRFPLNRRLSEHQSRSGRCGEEKHFALPLIEPAARSYSD